jgi:hypothetical protein
LVIGKLNSFTQAAFGGLVAGEGNTISNEGISISGGINGIASGLYSSISGGAANTASGPQRHWRLYQCGQRPARKRHRRREERRKWTRNGRDRR